MQNINFTLYIVELCMGLTEWLVVKSAGPTILATTKLHGK